MKYNMSGRGFASVARAAVAAVALCFAVSASVMAAEPTMNAPATTPAPGVSPAKGEFDNVPEQAFFLCGGIEDVEKNAAKLGA